MCQIPFDYICLLLQYAIPFILQPFQISSEFEKNVFQDVVLRLKGLCLFFLCIMLVDVLNFSPFMPLKRLVLVILGHFPFSFACFFFQGKKTNQFWFWRFKKFMVAHDKGDAWVKRMIITSDKSSSVFFEFPIRFVGLVTVFSGNWNVSLFFFGYCRAGELVVSTQMSTWECIFVTRKQ